jgi:hypothetical protein
MIVTREIVASKIGEWLRHEITLDQLVDWSENALREATFDAAAAGEIAEVVGRLGLADVRAFGLTWDDCEKLLQRLGYKAHVEILNA